MVLHRNDIRSWKVEERGLLMVKQRNPTWEDCRNRKFLLLEVQAPEEEVVPLVAMWPETGEHQRLEVRRDLGEEGHPVLGAELW